jgi:hypothetical protein
MCCCRNEEVKTRANEEEEVDEETPILIFDVSVV